MKYLKMPKLPALKDSMGAPVQNQDGAIGFIVAWLLGVPMSVLLLIFLIRG